MPIPYGAGLDWGPEKQDNSVIQVTTSEGNVLNIPKYMTQKLTGAPNYLPGMKAKNAWEALQMVKAMKAQKAAKTVSKVAKPKSIATGPKTVKQGNGYAAQIEVPDLPNYQELFDAYKMTKASRLNINNILDKLSPEERANVMKVMMYDPDKYLGKWLGNITPQRAASSIKNIRRRLPGEYTPLRVKSLDQTRPNMGTGIFQKFDDATSKTAGFKRTTNKY